MNTHSLKMIVVFLSLAALVSSSQAGDKRYLGGSVAQRPQDLMLHFVQRHAFVADHQ